MRLGIDFGTTRIVVAAVDRGNYPVVSFEDSEGTPRDWFPPLVASRGGRRLYGWQAWAAQTDPAATVVRSLKRILEDAGPGTLVELGHERVQLQVILKEMVEALRTAIIGSSSLPGARSGALEAMLGVPANANSNQRFLTVEPFQRAGFQVIGLLNEPSAASIEYGHVVRSGKPAELVLVYDLGGGTFDASLVELSEKTHSVIASEGISSLGGDDFDIVLAELALEMAGISGELTQSEIFLLHEECRNHKEALHPNTRRISVDLGSVRNGWPEVSVPAATYYDRCRPLVDRTVEATLRLLAEHDKGRRLEAVYVTGGGSELPLVARALREHFGRKVRRSPYTHSATAIGLAIQADEQSGYVLREQFTRHFGVWREAESGAVLVFDPLFEKGARLPAPGEPPLMIVRTYLSAHNLGHFRYLECSHRALDGRPTGDITIWDEIRFPFDPSLAARQDLGAAAVHRVDASAAREIEERYTCDSTGGLSVRIANRSDNYERRYRLGRWAATAEVVVPGRKKRPGSKAGAGHGTLDRLTE